MNSRTIKQRIKTIRRQLNKKNINCLIVTKPANITYITGFSGSDSWAVITPKNVYLLTDSRYIEQAQNQCPHCRIIQSGGPIIEATARLFKKLKSVQAAAVEDSVSVAAFKTLKKNLGGRLKTAANIIESVRRTKNDDEIAAIEAAVRIAAQALKQTLRSIKPGLTENELAGILDFQIRKLGAVNSFETIAAFGSNASRPHHQPGGRKLKKNDTILIDFGVRYKNYCCDLTRCFTVGRTPGFYKKVYGAVQKAQAAALKIVKAGVELRQVDSAARKIIAESDLPVYGHGTGHGLGLEVHEAPSLSGRNKGKLETGMVITIEPAVYLPGKLGVRLEDNILVTPNGYKILTRNCPHNHLLPV